MFVGRGGFGGRVGVGYSCSCPSRSQICCGQGSSALLPWRRSVIAVQRAFRRHFDISLRTPDQKCVNVDKCLPNNGECLQRKERTSEKLEIRGKREALFLPPPHFYDRLIPKQEHTLEPGQIQRQLRPCACG
ncbi:hypothetical protein TNCV_4418241 [Trichonephila clavipes]|nr:hypothetical protein TNCV_4418241 [Trichonephila clavipes]